MPILAEDPKERAQREAKEREFLTETEERRLAHNLEVARLQVEVEVNRAKRWGWVRIFMAPVFITFGILITILVVKGKEVPESLTEFLSG